MSNERTYRRDGWTLYLDRERFAPDNPELAYHAWVEAPNGPGSRYEDALREGFVGFATKIPSGVYEWLYGLWGTYSEFVHECFEEHGVR